MILVLVFVVACMILGVAYSTKENSALYAVFAVYLLSVSERFQWLLRQFIAVQSFMVSAERMLQFENFKAEKELR